MVTLIVTAKLNGVDPLAWLADVLAPSPACRKAGSMSCCHGNGSSPAYAYGWLKEAGFENVPAMEAPGRAPLEVRKGRRSEIPEASAVHQANRPPHGELRPLAE